MPHIILSGGTKIEIPQEEYKRFANIGRFTSVPIRFGIGNKVTFINSLEIAAVLPSDLPKLTEITGPEGKEILAEIEVFINAEIERAPNSKGIKDLKSKFFEKLG